MRPAYFSQIRERRRRLRAISLAELMVATFILSLISIAAFKIMAEGAQYLRVNQLAIDGQRTGLGLLSELGSGLQATKPSLINVQPEGLVFASPFKLDSTVEFDPVNSELLWQRWICYYRDGNEVTRREIALTLPTSNPGSPPEPSAFASVDVAKLMGREITVFQITQVTATPPVWAIDLTVGSMTDSSKYGIELHSEVGPRN